MYRVTVLASALSFILASAASADIALPKHLKEVDPRVRFRGIEEHADYVFFLWFYISASSPFGSPPRLIELENSEVFNLNARRRIFNMAVLAMPRKDFDKRKADDPSLAWLVGKPMANEPPPLSWLKNLPEVQYRFVKHPSTAASAYDEETPITTYRVIINEGKLEVEVLTMPEPPSWDREPPPVRRWPIWVGGIVIALSLGGLGIWFARRRWRKTEPFPDVTGESTST